MPRLISTRSMPYLIAVLLSIACSVWIAHRETVINPDAICYLQSAAAMQENFHSAITLCDQAKWPFYSFLIASVVKVTHLPYITAAYSLDGFFSLLTVLFFMGILSFLTEKTYLEKNKTLIISLAAAVILLAHEFNAVKNYIIRDHGFWAFYLASILFLLYYFRARQFRYALAWNISSLLAMLFRVEGAIFLLIIPFIAWFETQQTKMMRGKTFLMLSSVTIIISALVGGLLLFSHLPMTERLPELQFQLLHGALLLKQNFQLKSLALAQSVLGESGARDAAPVLFITLINWYFVSVIINLSLIYSVLVGYALGKKILVMNQATRLILSGYIIINVLITAIFLGQNMFLSKRYLIALSLTLMLWVPFALYDLIQQWPRRKWPLILALLFIFISSLGGIFDFGYSKKYIYDAGQWLAKNMRKNTVLYSNDLQLMYYSQQFGNQIFLRFKTYQDPHALTQAHWKKYDYLAIRIDQKELDSTKNSLRDTSLLPIQIFHNKRGDQVRIYRRSS